MPSLGVLEQPVESYANAAFLGRIFGVFFLKEGSCVFLCFGVFYFPERWIWTVSSIRFQVHSNQNLPSFTQNIDCFKA